MKKIVLIVIILIFLAGIVFVGRLFLTRGQKAMGGLKVTSIPQASIFLDADNIGRTPFEDKIKPGDYTLKLIPEDGEESVSSWQGKIKISANVLTYVNRELSSSDLTSAGETLSLEKISGKTPEIAITSVPEGAKISLDGEDKGAASLILRNITPGDHEISLSAPGFVTRSIKVHAAQGYKLMADFQLALIPGEEGDTNEDEDGDGETGEKELEKPYVTILDTPTGWLRVREEPTTTATEAAKINPGETYSFLDEESGWYQIEYEKGKEGWISGQYADKVE
ncbi:PEGA domain-containing protein [Candidatus Microgenomates bacterium]|nr:PEGA domain-containing protein [Candidatus Microgenomates bacterium]